MTLKLRGTYLGQNLKLKKYPRLTGRIVPKRVLQLLVLQKLSGKKTY